MKRVDDYTREELAQADDELISKLIEIEIAEAGIKPVEAPVKPSLEEIGIVRNDIAFEVKGILCKSREDAITIANIETFSTQYEYRIGYDYKWLEPQLEAKVEEKVFYFQDDVLRIASALQANEAKMSDYKSKKNTYDDWLEKTSNIREYIWDQVSAAKKFMSKIENAQKAYAKYLDLADNDESIAKRFFRDAFKDEPELMEIVIGETPPVEESESDDQ